MLSQYVLTLAAGDAPLRQEWAYRLYAALLEEAPAPFGAAAHRDGATPVSQHLARNGGQWRWTVSLLGTESEALLGPVLEGRRIYRLEKEKIHLSVAEIKTRGVADVDELFALGERGGNLHRLRFASPAAFKSQGRYVTLPTPWLLLQSLVKQWNGCISDCPIEDGDGQGVRAMAEGLVFRAFRLESRTYRLKGSGIPGFAGELTVENRLEGFHRQLANALLQFGSFSGVGIKTALGMGGVERLP